jgi:hypothetical protein
MAFFNNIQPNGTLQASFATAVAVEQLKQPLGLCRIADIPLVPLPQGYNIVPFGRY